MIIKQNQWNDLSLEGLNWKIWESTKPAEKGDSQIIIRYGENGWVILMGKDQRENEQL